MVLESRRKGFQGHLTRPFLPDGLGGAKGWQIIHQSQRIKGHAEQSESQEVAGGTAGHKAAVRVGHHSPPPVAVALQRMHTGRCRSAHPGDAGRSAGLLLCSVHLPNPSGMPHH